MNYKNLLISLKFKPKENSAALFFKEYPQAGNYCIEVDFEKQLIHYGEKIRFDNATTQNFTKQENFVVLECVDRLLTTGYKPESIFLEKAYPAGRGTTKYLDILVYQEEKPYLMIECKTYGEQFNNELKKVQKDGGQLFTYFQQDTKTEWLMLYASALVEDKIVSEYKIIKIEEEFRSAGNIENVFKLWKGTFNDLNFWETSPYELKEKVFTKAQLVELTEDRGKKLFHGFATILRKHSVSDKPNAFNVIFNLFLAKLYDEQKGEDDELEFQWKENDDPVDFQIRLHNLHKEGLNDFLNKEIEGIYDKDFDVKTAEERYKVKKKLLKFNKLFDIKSVLNDDDFEQNQRVLKEVVQLIEKYRIRYPRKQKYLSDFFELLLTTGLKQEVGQYFTPQPIAKFIVKSLPIPAMIEQELNNPTPKLPAVIDYAAGSGHFITEIMEEFQDIIDKLDTSNFYPNAKTKAKVWSQEGEPYSWASSYIYGIEKDYRLVKVAKVGCYFYGDGQAQIIHGDGLDSLTNPPKSYIGLLEQNRNDEDSTKNKFSILVANPPYSVDFCKDDLEYINSFKEFSLYPYLTDNSKEIECLFVERAKQLLKDGGVAGIILPKSILEKEGIYTKAREIIFNYFEIIAIVQLGSYAFMATGVKTVILFLRRRNNSNCQNFALYLENSLNTLHDNTINGIEKPISKYIAHVWETINFDDYVTLLKKEPNKIILEHDIYKEYKNNIKAKTEKDFWDKLIETEKEKLFYFILTYPQKIVLIKTGEKEDEKHFLGYKYSDRRETQGILPMQIGKSIEECTDLFDNENFENPQKASSYIFQAFNGNLNLPISTHLIDNISYCDLVHLLTFNNANFEKDLSLTFKEKVEFETKLDKKRLGNIFVKIESGKRPKGGVAQYRSGIPSLGGEHIGPDGKMNYSKMKFVPEDYFKSAQQGILEDLDILLCKDGALTGKVALFKKSDFQYSKGMINEHVFALKTDNEITQKYVFYILYSEQGQKILKANVTGTAQGGLNRNNLENIQIPFPPIDVQQRIVSEVELLEEKAKTIVIPNFNGEVEKILKKYL